MRRFYNQKLVWIRGAGDLATGIAVRLLNSGFQVVFSEIEQPTVIRTSISFATAVYEGNFEVENHTARLCHSVLEIQKALEEKVTPVFIGDELSAIDIIKPMAFIEGTIRKRAFEVPREQVPFCIGIGPGFNAGSDVDAVIETKRGHYLGCVIYSGEAVPNTGIPGDIGGYTTERVIHAPEAGIVSAICHIGDNVKTGQNIAQIGSDCFVKATIDGVLRGMIHDGLYVEKGTKMADIDPRCEIEHCFTISDKARAIGGGVLEALMHFNSFNSKGNCL